MTRCSDNIYFDKAVSNNNQAICNSITSSDLKYNCLSTIIFSKISDSNYSGGADICNLLNSSDKTYCQNKLSNENDVNNLQTAIKNNDIKVCSKIISKELKTKCNDVINLKLAISSKDIYLCYKITDTSLKNQCNDTLNKINTK